MFLAAFIGGFMIGLAAATLLVCNGDILGFSGIVSSIVLSLPVSLQDSQQHWKLVFLASFIVTSHFVIGPRYDDHHTAGTEEAHHVHSFLRYLVAGFLVGFGSQLGNGCTSGHGTYEFFAVVYGVFEVNDWNLSLNHWRFFSHILNMLFLLSLFSPRNLWHVSFQSTIHCRRFDIYEFSRHYHYYSHAQHANTTSTTTTRQCQGRRT
jgi:hypothetical protein